MNKFITTLAILAIAVCVIRIVCIVYSAHRMASLIRVVEAHGYNPVGDALFKPIILLVVCITWLFTGAGH